jgi:5-methylcytosine-specific restriction protein A
MPSRPPSLRKKPERTTGWSKHKTRQERGYGAAHDRMRSQVLREEPTCRECRKTGRVAVAVIADHITPKAEGGTDGRGNYQGLCKACHTVKTAVESARGRRKPALISR